MSIDLCVVNYNTRPLLERLINTLHEDAQSYCQLWNLYIADNGSTDDSLKWLQDNCSEYQPDTPYFITAVFANKNIGFAAAVNQLAAYGTSEIIGILNADVWMSTADVEAILRVFEEHPEIAILGPKQRDENGYVTAGGIFGSLERPAHRGWKVHDPDDLQYRDLCQAVTVSGSAYFIRRSAWDTLAQCSTYRTFLKEVMPTSSGGAFLETSHYY